MRVLAAILVLACLASCGPTTTFGGGSISSTGSSRNWPYLPVAMRVHPLTRVVRDAATGHLQVEVRIEFRDVDGHVTRAVGLVDVVLTVDGRETQSWSFDLTDLKENRRRYDDVTRTYRFLLGVADQEAFNIASKIGLDAAFVADRPLQASFGLK